MADERRYDEEEVARIFRIATEERTEAPTRGSSRGLTLAEIQDIAEEVGVSRELVVRAAARVRTPAGAERSGPLGVPIRVRRIVDLPRALTDAEWERLVTLLRRTFDAPGEPHESGNLRAWTNGNLQVMVEPGESGYQLRLSTRKGDVVPFLSVAASMLVIAVILVLLSLLTGGDLDVRAATLLGLLGAFGIGANLVRLPFWSRIRARQMDEIAASVSEWVAVPPGDRGDS